MDSLGLALGERHSMCVGMDPDISRTGAFSKFLEDLDHAISKIIIENDYHSLYELTDKCINYDEFQHLVQVHKWTSMFDDIRSARSGRNSCKLSLDFNPSSYDPYSNPYRNVYQCVCMTAYLVRRQVNKETDTTELVFTTYLLNFVFSTTSNTQRSEIRLVTTFLYPTKDTRKDSWTDNDILKNKG